MTGFRKPSERGFTLLELMASMVAAIFVILAALLMSRNSMSAFMDETRVSNTQLSARVGLDALAGDVARAGFMASANIMADPNVCPTPGPTSGTPLVQLQSIFYQTGATIQAGAGSTAAQNALPAASYAQGLSPDSITIGANFATSDAYLISDVNVGGAGQCAGTAVVLQAPSAYNTAAARLLATTAGTVNGLANAFPPGRLLRIQNQLGTSQFVEINNVVTPVAANQQIVICLAPAIPYTTAAGQVSANCGGQGFCEGCLANTVNMMRYSVQSLAGTTGYGWAYPETGTIGDAVKYDLVREEMDFNGTVIAGTPFIVSEYVVDLGFSFTVDTSPSQLALPAGTYWANPIMTAFPWGNANNQAVASDVTLAGPSVQPPNMPMPQRIRSVFVRMTTRARDADRSNMVGAAGPFLNRYMIPIGGVPSQQYARTRTLTEEVALINLRGIRW